MRRVALLALSEADHGSLTDCASVDSTQSLAARMLFGATSVALLALSEADHGSLTDCASVDSTQSLAARMLFGATSGVACVE